MSKFRLFESRLIYRRRSIETSPCSDQQNQGPQESQSSNSFNIDVMSPTLPAGKVEFKSGATFESSSRELPKALAEKGLSFNAQSFDTETQGDKTKLTLKQDSEVELSNTAVLENIYMKGEVEYLSPMSQESIRKMRQSTALGVSGQELNTLFGEAINNIMDIFSDPNQNFAQKLASVLNLILEKLGLGSTTTQTQATANENLTLEQTQGVQNEVTERLGLQEIQSKPLINLSEIPSSIPEPHNLSDYLTHKTVNDQTQKRTILTKPGSTFRVPDDFQSMTTNDFEEKFNNIPDNRSDIENTLNQGLAAENPNGNPGFTSLLGLMQQVVRLSDDSQSRERQAVIEQITQNHIGERNPNNNLAGKFLEMYSGSTQ